MIKSFNNNFSSLYSAEMLQTVTAGLAGLGVLLIFFSLILFLMKKSANARRLRRIVRRDYFLIAGRSALSDKIFKQLTLAGANIIYTGGEKLYKSVHRSAYLNCEIDEYILKRLRIANSPKKITVFCAYNDDADNLAAALKFQSALKSKSRACGNRAVRVSYKNIGKAQFYQFAGKEIKFFNEAELTAIQFTESYPIRNYLPQIDLTVKRALQNSAKNTFLDLPEVSAQVKASGEGAGLSEPEKSSGADVIIVEEKEFALRRIFVGFTDVNAEILEKTVLSEDIPEDEMRAIVFDKDADKLLPAFYNRENDVFDIDTISAKTDKKLKLIALKVAPEAYELYEKISLICSDKNLCAVYIDDADELNSIETALELRAILKEKSLLAFVKIFVKNSLEHEQISAINEGCPIDEQIVLFGSFESIFPLMF